MGLVNTGTTVDMKVYLTELGRRRLLEQGFVPTSFSISDEDVNYNANLFVTQEVTDLTGDYNDNVYSLSKNITIKNQIIRES
jgi:ribose 5-phosphate isomerase